MAKGKGFSYKKAEFKNKMSEGRKNSRQNRRSRNRQERAGVAKSLRGQRYAHRETMYREGTKRIEARTRARNIMAAGTAAGEVTTGPTTAAAYNLTSSKDTRSSSVPIEKIPYGSNAELEQMDEDYSTSYIQR